MANRTALYRKYRPNNFDEIFGQENIIKILKNAVITGRVSHAYLFSGPRGTGKTSTARILAKVVNCHKPLAGNPDNSCSNCAMINEGKSLDIIELDAASHTQVDNIREVIIEKTNFLPTSLKYKIYIIDEAHMLSKSSFNALLKTLEEPPAHTIFILATTEPQKLPETIRSRCQRFTFKRISKETIKKRLAEISQKEGLKIDESALDLIAKSAEGGFRDAISYLDQASTTEKDLIDLKMVEEILGFATHQKALELTEALIRKDTVSSLSIIKKLQEDGHDMTLLIRNLLEILRKILIDKVNGEDGEEIKVYQNIVQAKPAEIIRIMEVILKCQEVYRHSAIPTLSLEVAAVKITEIGKIKQDQVENDVTEASEPVAETKEKAVSKKTFLTPTNNQWNQVMMEVKSKNNSIHAFLKACQPDFDGDNVCLYFPYRFHKERIDDEKNKVIVEKAFESVTGRKCRIKCVLKSNIKEIKKPEVNDDLLEDALEIFGGEVIE